MRKLGIVSVAELVPLVRSLDPLTEESSVLQTLEAAKRLLESLADRSIRGGRHVRAALRQIAEFLLSSKSLRYTFILYASTIPEEACASHGERNS